MEVLGLPENEYVCLDTKAFDAAISKKQDLINTYNELNTTYDRIVDELMKNWKGKGAAAFKRDAQTVKTNIVGIFDILKIMCDTLTDCREIFSECDTSMGEYNRNPDVESN